MTKFKEGDLVKVINSTYIPSTHSKSYIGKNKVIVEYYLGTYRIDDLGFNESDLELITEPKTLDNLEVGDKIKAGSYMKTITGIMKNYNTVDNNGNECWYTVEDLFNFGYTPFTQPTTTIDGKTYILTEELKKAIEESEEV